MRSAVAGRTPGAGDLEKAVATVHTSWTAAQFPLGKAVQSAFNESQRQAPGFAEGPSSLIEGHLPGMSV